MCNIFFQFVTDLDYGINVSLCAQQEWLSYNIFTFAGHKISNVLITSSGGGCVQETYEMGSKFLDNLQADPGDHSVYTGLYSLSLHYFYYRI